MNNTIVGIGHQMASVALRDPMALRHRGPAFPASPRRRLHRIHDPQITALPQQEVASC